MPTSSRHKCYFQKMVRHAALRGLYEVEKTIGCGGFAKVKLATHLATGEKVAIKIMEKAGLGDDLPRIKLELKALKTLSHQHICKLYQVIETETHFFIVIEYCSGGELFDHIVEKNRLTEAESRMFFRQIVSAVAYLHSLGYAHRDLKPENVLLDKDQNLKLIDFGLCARPEGGIENPLFTSCGSPTYAAPELVLGKQYLGPEVDVWAMGVLLYALLAGSLPFDDLSIDSLYKKILSGRYAEPSYMSPESKRLIRSMLQVNPKNRITVTELLSHPWLTLGILDPVDCTPEDWKKFDKECINALAKYYEVPEDVVWRYVCKWKYDYHTATYLLLLARKKRGSSVKLQSVSLNARLRAVLRQGTPNHPDVARLKLQKLPLTTIQEPNHQQQPPRIFEEIRNSRDANHTANYSVAKAAVSNNTPSKKPPQYIMVDSPRQKDNTAAAASTPISITPRSDEVFVNNSLLVARRGGERRRFLEPQKSSSSVSGDDAVVTVARKPQKRMWSPTFDDEPSPVPSKKLTIRKSTPKTPERKKLNSASDTPGSARRVLGSIERSLHKVRHVLTPRRTPSKDTSQPVVLSNKDLCNVSTTQCSDPEFVITELSKALQRKGFQCNRKGFLLRGKVEANVLHHCSGCSFELEVCYLPHMGPNLAKLSSSSSQNCETPTKSILTNGILNFDTPTNEKRSISTPGASLCLKNNENSGSRNTNKQSDWIDRPFAFVGIKRKRLKGDSWCYKKVCEEILAVTVKDLRPMTESAV